ncbi:MAG: 23S rRNA (uracil(1939)-C(5))-methyltransferase RlmD [Clostridia bacterium]|nr:23S rRNA (uracil(1939)-C(5))-methyltransferase RlmD [Clostridia bacterium]
MCSHFGACGGCAYQSMSYANQLKFKEKQVKELIDNAINNANSVLLGIDDSDSTNNCHNIYDNTIKSNITDKLNDKEENIVYTYHGINPSPSDTEYRNKMEFSFGDEVKDGPLALGLHKINSMYDIVAIKDCKLVSNDFNKLVDCALKFGTDHEYSYYRKMQHVGFLRHLLVRRSISNNSLLVAIVTSSQGELDAKDFVKRVLELELEGEITGILHIVNDSKADVVMSDETHILYGEDYFYESILGLKFKITPFSFFQTNTKGAEVLYNVARKYVGDTKNKVVFDLYSGTGTIAQMLAAVASKVVGVEIVEEAVEAAKENAKLNGLDNCEFIAGDVLTVIDDLDYKPDIIVVDPPRSGVNPKAVKKLAAYGIEQIVYISCNPVSLAENIEEFAKFGYKVSDVELVDMFPCTRHVETVCVLRKVNKGF